MNDFDIMGFIIGAGRFIVMLGALIFVHELGHFIAAKLSNVYVVRFSLGFGKRLFGFKFKGGETDYCLSAIPLGGYVKMVGQEDLPRTEEEAAEAEPDLPDVPPERCFNTQPARNRLAIGFAGPLMNLFFAFPLFWLVFMVGIQIPIYTKHTRIGTVYEGKPAEQAGIKPGQRVLSINGEPVKKWEEVQLTIWTNEGKELDLELEDLSGRVSHVTAVPARDEGASRATLGIEPLVVDAISIVVPGMAADRAGFKEGDIVLAYDDSPADNASLAKLVEAVNESAGQPMTVTVLREERVKTIALVPEEVSIIEGVGFQRNVVAYVDEETASERAALLQRGDVVTAVDGERLETEAVEDILTAAIYGYEGEELTLTVERGRGLFSKTEVLDVTVPVGRTGRIGVGFSTVVLEKFGPVEAAKKGMRAFVASFSLTMKTIYYLVSGKVSTKEMAGPIGIAVMTEKSLDMGIGYYLNLIAFITINLAIINLLPIPMLDGGLILLTLVEAVRRRPLEEKYLIVLQKVGIVFIAFIILMATYNDVGRVIRYFVGGEFLE
ncbi:MAG: RIP metalloprotease RseP [Candidatus Abyssubacteria bacterium]|nr:RIP metalloprotease RseP [Candidatus Abyssubacteria bacterium]